MYAYLRIHILCNRLISIVVCLSRVSITLVKFTDCRPSDAVVVAVASNNAASARKDLNLFDMRKKLKTAQQVPDTKLTVRQKRTLAINQALLQLHSNQVRSMISSVVRYCSL